MCGIVAVLRRRATVGAAAPREILARVEEAAADWPSSGSPAETLHRQLARIAERLEAADSELKRPPALRDLLRDSSYRERLGAPLGSLGAAQRELEARLDNGELELQPADLEVLNATLVRLKDALWAIQRDRMETARAVGDLAAGLGGQDALAAYASIHLVLSGLDRLEVRGRDSAGVHVLVSGHRLDPGSSQVRELLARRRDDRLARGGAARMVKGCLSLLYKAAAEIGKLGDNGAVLRRAIRSDPLLQLALAEAGAEVAVLGHTRWASVGLINETNAHPLTEVETDGRVGPPVVAVLNGDVDNYAELAAEEELRIAEEITTDAKVIPVLVSRRLGAGEPPAEAFRQTVASFVGSVAVAAMTPEAPERLLLAQRGSGQALYVGLSPDTFLVASEPYGLVEETATFLRLDGETPGNPDNPSASRGQVVVLDAGRAGTLEGIERIAYDGTPLPVSAAELQRAEITTRDVDRGEFSHFLRKEISEAPASFRKTLRGKIRTLDGRLRVELGQGVVPPQLAGRLRRGDLRRLYVIGQGTAAVAGQGVAYAFESMLADSCRVRAMPATELSGFSLLDDMSDTLVVAISQSGTTTDTNRTVDLVRSRGAAVIAIVNRRHSDLANKVDGVLYTSDGRDVEMSVASTKAFYSQIAAGFLLAVGLRQALDGDAVDQRGEGPSREILEALRRMPTAMERVLERSETIARIAQRHGPHKRYWAVVGNGTNRIAAEEVRIKLSELCYKSIACDVTEDKKHIDLSSEPLILVCAAGLAGSTADDVAKEVGIYRAHKATPIVISSDGEERFAAAVEGVAVPRVHPALDFVLAALAGHLFGYHAALAIDAQAHSLREARSAIEAVVRRVASSGGDLLERLRPPLEASASTFFERLRERMYDGHLEASTAVEVASLLRVVDGTIPLDVFAQQFRQPGTPGVVVEALTAALTRAIDELTRPVDAIKHQAKTVTVGISRTDEALLTVPLVQELLATGVDRDHLGYDDLRTLAALDPVVAKVIGFTRYRLEGEPQADDCSIEVAAVGGVSGQLTSRTNRQPVLRGTKRQVALERRILVALGRSDGRPVVIVPEIDRRRVVGLVLLHVRYRERASAASLRGVLGGYRGRYTALRNAVMETEPGFCEELLESIAVADLLCQPVHVIAERWRGEDRQPVERRVAAADPSSRGRTG